MPPSGSPDARWKRWLLPLRSTRNRCIAEVHFVSLVVRSAVIAVGADRSLDSRTLLIAVIREAAVARTR